MFLTCSGNEVRVWHVSTGSELVKISLPGNITCNDIVLTADGKTILSGNIEHWSTVKIYFL